MEQIPSFHAAGDAPADQDAQESSSPHVVDLEELLDRCMGNLDLAERLLRKFQETFPQELAKLESALETGDAKQLSREAHHVKGVSASVSAAGLRRAAAELEELCSTGRMEEVPKQIDRVRYEWTRYLFRPPFPTPRDDSS